MYNVALVYVYVYACPLSIEHTEKTGTGMAATFVPMHETQTVLCHPVEVTQKRKYVCSVLRNGKESWGASGSTRKEKTNERIFRNTLLS